MKALCEEKFKAVHTVLELKGELDLRNSTKANLRD